MDQAEIKNEIIEASVGKQEEVLLKISDVIKSGLSTHDKLIAIKHAVYRAINYHEEAVKEATGCNPIQLDLPSPNPLRATT